MKLTFGYDELATLANEYALKDKIDENIAFHLEGVEDGIAVRVTKFKFSIFTLKARIYLRFVRFDDGILTLSIRFKNIFFELIKKVVFLLADALLKKFMKTEDEDDVDLTKYISISTSKITVKLNELLQVQELPGYVNYISGEAGTLSIDFKIFGPSQTNAGLPPAPEA